MSRRRASHDPLAPSPDRRWYVVRSLHGSVLESCELPMNTDLRRVFIEAMLRWMDAGWTLGEFSSVSASFFCDLYPERRMVSIDPTDPHAVPPYGGAHLGERAR